MHALSADSLFFGDLAEGHVIKYHIFIYTPLVLRQELSIEIIQKTLCTIFSISGHCDIIL